MKRIIGAVPDNLLQDIYLKLGALPNLFRDKVGEECSWSTPTFYRKLKHITTISNAEREKIIDVLDEVFKETWDYCAKYRRTKR